MKGFEALAIVGLIVLGTAGFEALVIMGLIVLGLIFIFENSLTGRKKKIDKNFNEMLKTYINFPMVLYGLKSHLKKIQNNKPFLETHGWVRDDLVEIIKEYEICYGNMTIVLIEIQDNNEIDTAEKAGFILKSLVKDRQEIEDKLRLLEPKRKNIESLFLSLKTLLSIYQRGKIDIL